MILLTVVLGVVLLVALHMFCTVRQQWAIITALRQVPCDPEHHWLWGHAPILLKDLGASLDWYLETSLKNNSKLVHTRYGPLLFNTVELTHPDTARVCLATADPKAGGYDPLLAWLGDGLLLSSGKKWARNRRLLTGAFHFDVLKPYLSVYKETADVLLELLLKHEDRSVDMVPYLKQYTLDVMLRCACSYESNCQTTGRHAPYIEAVYELSRLAVKRSLSFLAQSDFVYALMPDSWRYRKLCNLVHEFSMDIIKSRRAELKKRKERGNDVLTNLECKKRKYLDFIDILLEAKDDEGCGLTDEEIRAEVDTFLFEGHDTTASGLSWTLYNLARFPDHQEKCRAEVDEIFEGKENLEWEDLKKLTYLKYCIKESTRLFPPVPTVGRQLAEDKTFDKYMLLKGTWVYVHFYSIHHRPEIWDNPEEFDPLRFTPERSKGRHSHAFMPFSAGPRNCIGQEFALNEELVVLSHILRKFVFTLDESRGPVTKYRNLILQPKPGVFINLQHRDSGQVHAYTSL